MTDLYQLLADNQIEYERHDHPPVYTVADVERLVPPLPAAIGYVGVLLPLLFSEMRLLR